MSTILL